MKPARKALVAPRWMFAAVSLRVVRSLSLAMRVAAGRALRGAGFRLALATDLAVTTEAAGLSRGKVGAGHDFFLSDSLVSENHDPHSRMRSTTRCP